VADDDREWTKALDPIALSRTRYGGFAVDDLDVSHLGQIAVPGATGSTLRPSLLNGPGGEP
jgi:hypothetical protein